MRVGAGDRLGGRQPKLSNDEDARVHLALREDDCMPGEEAGGDVGEREVEGDGAVRILEGEAALELGQHAEHLGHVQSRLGELMSQCR